MQVSELREVLAEIEDILATAGAKKSAEDFSELQQIFQGSEDEDVDRFLDDLRRLYAPSKKPKLKLVESIDELVVERYLTLLQKCADDDGDIDQIVDELSSDLAVKKPEANSIQHKFIKGREAWPSKKAAIDAIKKSLIHRRREAEKLARIKSTTPW